MTYYGGEGQYKTDSRDIRGTVARGKITSTLKNQCEYGFKILTGFIINNLNHIYVVLGYARNKFNNKNEFMIAGDAGTIDAKTVHTNFYANSFLLGFGFERAVESIRYGIEGFCKLNQTNRDIQNNLFATDLGAVINSSSKLSIRESYGLLFKVTYTFASSNS